MDFRRYFLWGALFVSGYLLFLQWNQDYGTAATAQTASQSAETVVATNSDLPSENNQVQAASDTAIPDQATEVAKGQLIHVKTDTLDVAINPVGGDIVQASLVQYTKTIKGKEPLVILDNGNERVYVTQSGLVGQNGPDANAAGRPVYKTEQMAYSLEIGQGKEKGQGKLDVNLYYTDEKGVSYTKTFQFKEGTYSIRQVMTVNNTSNEAWSGALFAQIKRDNSEDPSTATSMGLQPYLGGAISNEENKYRKVKFSDMADEPVKETTTKGWVALLQHYFVSAWIPEQGQKVTLTARASNGFNIIGFVGQTVEVAAGQQRTLSSTFYVGPKLQDQLEATAENLDLTVDYGWLWWLAKPLFWLLTAIQSVVINWGVAIILIVVCVKALFFKLSAASYRSMAKMRKFGPELARLREQYGDDRQAMSQKMMELYKKEKINPLGGCLPILVQMPVFLSLYWVLMESVELRHAPFMLWINDLSSMDPFFVLPILMGLSMLGQQMLNPTPPDPMQARIMKIMPIAFTFFFLWFPAGLVLYWVVNNTLSIIQQYVITKSIEKGDA